MMNKTILVLMLAGFLTAGVSQEFKEWAGDDEAWHGRVTNGWSMLANELNYTESQESANQLHMIALQSGATYWNNTDLNWLVNALIDTTPKGYTRTLYARGLSGAQSGNPYYSDRLAQWVGYWSPTMCEALTEQYGTGGANCD